LSIKKGTVAHDTPTKDDPMLSVTVKYRVKLTSEGQVDKPKTRIALRGDMMKDETFTHSRWCPIAGFRALKIFLAFAAECRQRVYQLDFVAAFLRASLFLCFVFFLLLLLFLFLLFDICDSISSPSVSSAEPCCRAEGVMCLRSAASRFLLKSPMFSVVSDIVIDLSLLVSSLSFALVSWSPCVVSCTVALVVVGPKSLLINEGVGCSVAMKHRW
jgi:hypothetical protein